MFKGTHWSKMPNRDEIKERIRQKKLGSKHSDKTKAKMSVSQKKAYVAGHRVCTLNREEIIKRNKSLKNRLIVSKKQKGIPRPYQQNEKHGNWKGDEVSYSGLHYWIYRKLGSAMQCEYCGKKMENNHNIHWANKSGEYKRDLSDWLRLCVSCHRKYDYEKKEFVNSSICSSAAPVIS